MSTPTIPADTIEHFRSYLEERGCSAGTSQSYISEARGILRWLASEKKTLLDLDGELLVQYLQGRLIPGCATGRIFSALRGFFACLGLEKMNDHYGQWPAAALAMSLRQTKAPAEPLFDSDEKFQLFCAQIDTSTERGLRDRLLAEMLYIDRLGVTAVVRLRCSDVDLERGTLRFETGAQGKVRGCTYRMSESTREWMRRYTDLAVLSMDSDHPLFTTCKGPLCRQMVWKSLRRHAEKAGVQFRRRPQRKRNASSVEGEIALRTLHEQMRSWSATSATARSAESGGPEAQEGAPTPREAKKTPKQKESLENKPIAELLATLRPRALDQLMVRLHVDARSTAETETA